MKQFVPNLPVLPDNKTLTFRLIQEDFPNLPVSSDHKNRPKVTLRVALTIACKLALTVALRVAFRGWFKLQFRVGGLWIWILGSGIWVGA